MMYYAELADHEGPSKYRRASIEKISRSSEISLGLDDIRDVIGSREGSVFSMSCLEEGLENISGGDGNNYFFNLGEEYIQNLNDQSKEDSGFVPLSKTTTETHRVRRLSKSMNWSVGDNKARKVRFSNDEPEVRSIPAVEQEDYATLYYGVNELQRMFDEFREEERNARRHSIR